MSALLNTHRTAADVSRTRDVPQRIAIIRAVFALIWAAAVVIAVGDKVPHTDSDVPTAVALLLASYPLIDVIASLFSSTFGDTRVLRINAAISTLAVVGIAIAAFGSDAAATLVAFGAWAAISGAIQLGVAIHRPRAQGRQLPMIVSGGLSTIAGVSFIAQSGSDDANLAALAGYMALGALLILLWVRRSKTASQTGGSSRTRSTPDDCFSSQRAVALQRKSSGNAALAPASTSTPPRTNAQRR